MTEKRFKIVDEQFISYYGGTGHKISNGECGFWLWHDKTESQKVCDKLNSILDENEQLKEALIELKEIGDYQYASIKELSDENEQLEQTNQRLTIALKEIKEKTTIYLEMTKGEDQP